MSLTSNPYKTRNQTFDGSIDTSGTTTSVATSKNIPNLETKLLSRKLLSLCLPVLVSARNPMTSKFVIELKKVKIVPKKNNCPFY